jgi:hypothetical protein
MINEIKTGIQLNADGTQVTARAGKTGEMVIGNAHPRYYEPTVRGNIFSTGMTITSISNATFSTGTLGATATPIIGIWNPTNTGKNAVIMLAKLQLINTALQVTGAGAFVWCTAVNQSAISTGLTPLNRASLANSGSVCKGFAGTALTGLSGNLTVQNAAGLGGLLSNLSTLQTAVGLMPSAPTYVDNLEGCIIVPPGGVLALLCTTNPPVAISAASALVWEEVSIS